MFRYAKLGDMLRSIIEKKQQLKKILYQQSHALRGISVSAAYSLLSSVINNWGKLESAFDLIVQDGGLTVTNKYLMMIMMGELINTGKIVGGGKIKSLIMKYRHLLPKIQQKSKINKQVVQIRLRSNNKQFLNIARAIEQDYSGKKDETVENLYHLSQQEYSKLSKDQSLNIINSSGCVIQSFGSALPAFLLMHGVKQKWSVKSFDVIDACSAPGNKTIQIAQYLGSSGRVFAFEKNGRRYEALKQNLQKYQVQNVVPANQNFLEVNPNDQLYSKVKFIMLDPSCSGSGMLTNFSRDNISPDLQIQQDFEQFCLRKYNQLSQKQKQRVDNLHKFQLQLLHWAAKFKPKRLSYSTCSIFPKENEEVVQSFLAKHSRYYIKKHRISSNKGIKRGFGAGMEFCVRVDPRALTTDGFFVCVFSRKKI